MRPTLARRTTLWPRAAPVPCAVGDAKGEAMDEVRIATIGTSAICERFLDAVAQVPGARHVAAYSRDLARARAFAAAHGAPLAFDSLEALAASDGVDAVYVASPIAAHAPQALAMVAGGKHVLVEKAFASNAREAEAVFAAARERGVVALEAMRGLHVPSFALVEATLPELGRVRQATFRFSKVTSRMARLRAGERLNVFDPRLSEGALMDLGIYCVGPAVALWGEPREVRACAHTVAVPGETEGGPYATIDLAGEALLAYDGFVVDLSYAKTCDNVLPSQISGERAVLTMDECCCPRALTLHEHVDQGMIYGTGAGAGRALPVEIPANDMVCELARFVAAVRGDDEALAAVARFEGVTMGSLRVCDEVRRQVGVRFLADDEPAA